MDLSIVIPCLNVEDVLGRQLEALSGQEVDVDWEVVVVDNASTDATTAVAERHRGRLPALTVQVERQRGRHFACNTGARIASGRSIAFVDADDIVRPGYVAAMAKALSEHEIVAGSLRHKTTAGRDLEGFGRVQETAPMAGGWLPSASGANFGIRRSLFLREGGYSPEVPFGEDADLAWRLQLAGHEIAFCYDAAIDYYQRDSLTAMFRQHRRFGAAQALLFRRFRAQGMPRRGIRAALADWWKVLLAVPSMADPEVRARSLRRAARSIGRLEGSVRAKVFYP